MKAELFCLSSPEIYTALPHSIVMPGRAGDLIFLLRVMFLLQIEIGQWKVDELITLSFSPHLYSSYSLLALHYSTTYILLVVLFPFQTWAQVYVGLQESDTRLSSGPYTTYIKNAFNDILMHIQMHSCVPFLSAWSSSIRTIQCILLHFNAKCILASIESSIFYLLSFSSALHIMFTN